MITVRGLKKDFKTFQALKDIDLNVKKGEVYGFIGHNGAGKSTTMNILAGLSRPNAGECLINGMDIKKISHPGDLNVGYLPEDPRFYTWMTARETLSYLGKGNTVTNRKRVEEMLSWVGLREAANRRVGGFSRGMKQRLGIASALMHDPSLLILDEPSSALDPEGRSDVLRLIGELNQMGKTVFFSTHILSDVERICDTVGMIAAGKIIMEKPLDEMQKDHILPIFDIELTSPLKAQALDNLLGLAGVKDVKIAENNLSVYVMDTALLSKRLMAFFAGEDVPVLSFGLRKHTLEDIFMKEAASHEA